jgi:hypothetical protein
MSCLKTTWRKKTDNICTHEMYLFIVLNFVLVLIKRLLPSVTLLKRKNKE